MKYRLYIMILLSMAVIYTSFILMSCVADNETMARLGTIEKNNITISGQVEDLNNIEDQITAENIGQVLSKTQKGVFAVGDGGAVWVLGALVAMLVFFGYMVKLLMDRKRLFSIAYMISYSVQECSKSARYEVLSTVKSHPYQRALIKSFINKNGLHADLENKYANGQIKKQDI